MSQQQIYVNCRTNEKNGLDFKKILDATDKLVYELYRLTVMKQDYRGEFELNQRWL